MSRIDAAPLTAAAFAPFGEVLEADGTPDKIINQGLCGRFHDRATLDITDGRAGISLFKAEPRQLPLRLEMVERHPQGSQAFVPMSFDPFLVVVAPDAGGRPGAPRAFLTRSGQGINFHRGTWHGVLTPLHAPGLFAVIDRIGEGPNLEEHWFDEPYLIHATA
ncbi:ureidoglycolate lyase [Salipiger sp. PrR002]|uniref:ureidoglycolate lyase n=1 Tax=Salipiger sp. PrR002 TaxID=2706489 RepID=UPI0013BDBAA9|nr:ureidoglycolate lyase [Salipiger sp. PrR002]NDV98773.1 ureidoglycolate lyase [Salipiger sp. PrR002]NDW55510.1 ureidoglycolate lyase [Salipiger sp. PrR004]